MKTINLHDIIIEEDRQRQEFDDGKVHDLAVSIAATCLLHAPTLKADNRTLVAGEYRIRAMKHLFDTEGKVTLHYDGKPFTLPNIPFVSIYDLSEDEIYRLELEENLRRTDLTWQEEARAIQKVKKMMEKERPEVKKADVAQRVAEMEGKDAATNYDYRRTVQATQLEDFMDVPEVAEAPTLEEASKRAKAHTEKLFLETLADIELEAVREAKGQPTDPEAASSLINIHHKSYEAAVAYDIENVDVFIMDPPYFVGADTFGTQAKVEHNYNDTYDYAEIELFYRTLASSCYAVAKEDAHLFLFLDISWWPLAKCKLEEAGWKVWSRPLVWVKNIGMLPDPTRGPRNCYELILFATKGERFINSNVNFKDVLIHDVAKNKVHGAQKPESLYQELADMVCQKGDVVVDLFAGSGTIIRALKGRDYIIHAVEQEEENVKLCYASLGE